MNSSPTISRFTLPAICLWLLTLTSAVGQEPASPDALQSPAIQLTLNGRNTTVQVEDTNNPLILLQTSRGDMVFELFPEAAPRTIEHFLGLADGSKRHFDPRSGQQLSTPFYNGLTIHRVAADFLVQGGSPDGTATGGPGFVIPEEINASSLGLDRMPVLDQDGKPNSILGLQSELAFHEQVLEPLYRSLDINSPELLAGRVAEVREKLTALTVKQLYELQGYRYAERVRSRPMISGSLAMANHGPGSTGSQFFITLRDTDWLNGRYTVFGRLRAGLTVLDSIARTPVDASGRPVESITIFSVTRISN